MKLIIVIATFNSGTTLRECLDSILEQNYPGYSVFIKDGGSTDNTLSLLNEYSSKSDRIAFVSDVDHGVYDAWNISLKHVQGDWVTFLGSDDYFSDENTLQNVAAELALADQKSMRLAYGKNTIIDNHGRFKTTLGEDWISAQNNIHKHMTIRHPGCFCKLSLIRAIGGFDDSFKIIGDYDFILNAIKFTDIHFYKFVAVYHRVGGLSTSPSRLFEVIRETYRLRKKHDLKPHFYPDLIFFKRLALYLLSLLTSDKFVLTLLK